MLFLLNAKSNRDRRLIKSLRQDENKKAIARTAFGLAAVCAAHTGAMMHFEGLNLQDAIWLTETTATTTGYGDFFAKSWQGRVATSLLMYATGISLTATLLAQIGDFRQNRREEILKGKRNWNMKDHIVFLNAPCRNPMQYFSKLMTEFRKSALPVAKKSGFIVTPNLENGLAAELAKHDFVEINHEITSEEAFEKSNLAHASHIVVMSQDDDNPTSDSITFDMVARAREHNPNAIIVAEAVSDKNKDRLMAIGANHVIRPIRSYPELLANTLLAPGSEEIMADLFDNEGEEMVRYDVPVQGSWGDIQCALIQNDIGTPLGYIDANGDVIMAATMKPTQPIDAQGLFVVAREGNIKSDLEVGQEVNAGKLTFKAPAFG